MLPSERLHLFMLTGNFWSPESVDGGNTGGGDNGGSDGGDNGGTDSGNNGGVSAVGDEVWEDAIVTYPNPFTSTLKLDGLEKTIEYTFSDLSGRVVQTGTTSGTIETSFEAGIYHLTLYLNSGEKHIRLLKVD